MSLIRINTGEVKNSSLSLKASSNKITSIKNSVISIKECLDSRIKERRNIGSRISNVCEELKNLEQKVQSLQSFMDSSVDRYESAESKVSEEEQGWVSYWNIKYAREFTLSTLYNGYSMSQNALIKSGNSNDAGLTNDQKEEIINKTGVTLTALANLSSDKFKDGSIVEANGLKFQLFKKNGSVYVKVLGVEPDDAAAFLKTRESLTNQLGGTIKQNKGFTTKLINDGIPLYDESKAKFFNNNNNKMNKLFDGDLHPLEDFIKESAESKMHPIGNSAFGKTFSGNMKVWEGFQDFKGASNLTKFGKIAGDVGIVLTVADDFNGEFSSDNKENEGKSTGQKAAYALADVGVDVTAGSASMALGAELGTLIAPGVGTAVGAGIGIAVGFGVNWAVNTKLSDGKSVVDHVKDVVKHPIKSAEEFGGWVKGKVCSIFA